MTYILLSDGTAGLAQSNMHVSKVPAVSGKECQPVGYSALLPKGLQSPSQMSRHIIRQPSPQQPHVQSNNIVQLQTSQPQHVVQQSPQEQHALQQKLNDALPQPMLTMPIQQSVSTQRDLVMLMAQHGKVQQSQAKHVIQTQSPNIQQQRSGVLRPARFIAEKNESGTCQSPEAVASLSPSQVSSTGVNIQLVQQIKNMVGNNTSILQSPQGQQVRLSSPVRAQRPKKIIARSPRSKVNVRDSTPKATGKLKQLLAMKGTNDKIAPVGNELNQLNPTQTIPGQGMRVVVSNGMQYVIGGETPARSCVLTVPMSQAAQGQPCVAITDAQTVSSEKPNIPVQKPVQYMMPGAGGQHVILQTTPQIQMPVSSGVIKQNMLVSRHTIANTPARLPNALPGSIIQQQTVTPGTIKKQIRLQHHCPVTTVSQTQIPVGQTFPGVMSPRAPYRMGQPGQVICSTTPSAHGTQTVGSSTDVAKSQPIPKACSNPQISSLEAAVPDIQCDDSKEPQYVKGQTYSIKYNNGICLEVVWDGKFFKPKVQGSVTEPGKSVYKGMVKIVNNCAICCNSKL